MAGGLYGTYPKKIDNRSRIKDPDEFVRTGARALVVSSYIASIWYDGALQNLYLEFKDGAVGYFPGVPVVTARDMFLSQSMGRFERWILRGKYKYVPIRQRRSGAKVKLPGGGLLPPPGS